MVPPTAFPAGQQYGNESSLAVGDANGDGLVDVVTTSIGYVHLLLGNGLGELSPPTDLGGIGTYVTSVALADLNGDGAEDIIAGVDYEPEPVVLLLNEGLGNFGQPSKYGSLYGAQCCTTWRLRWRRLAGHCGSIRQLLRY